MFPDCFIYLFILRQVGRYWKYPDRGVFFSPVDRKGGSAAHIKVAVNKAEKFRAESRSRSGSCIHNSCFLQ